MRIENQIISLDESQMLLRGSSLRNTDWVYGIAIYTGHDSKVMMNSTKSKAKFSKIELTTNGYIFMGVVIQFVVCLTSALYSSLWERLVKTPDYDPIYLELDKYYDYPQPSNLTEWVQQTGHPSLFYTIPTNFGKWFIAMMNFVAISLLVSLEMVKFFQGLFIEYDHFMYDAEKDKPAKA